MAAPAPALRLHARTTAGGLGHLRPAPRSSRPTRLSSSFRFSRSRNNFRASLQSETRVTRRVSALGLGCVHSLDRTNRSVNLWPESEPLPQLRPPPSCPRSLDGDRQCLSLSDEHH